MDTFPLDSTVLTDLCTRLADGLHAPVAPLRTCLEILRHQQPMQGSAEQARAQMEQHIGELVMLVDNLTAVSQISQRPLRLHTARVRVAAVVGLALERSDPVFGQTHCLLQVDLPPQPVWLNADLVRLAQALTNLLLEAARTTLPGGQIQLRAAPVADRLEVTLQHDCRETPRQQIRGSSGWRFGLLIARALIEWHGGTLQTVRLGARARFTISLPVWTP